LNHGDDYEEKTCRGHGFDAETGFPWYDDLYLDVVVLADGSFHLLDEDELDEALQEGKITQDEYDIAWQEANLARN
jgi:predicted RNA-binding protein associated with RNAse of E/G family